MRLFGFCFLVSTCFLASVGTAAAQNELRVALAGRTAEGVTIDWPNEGKKECVRAQSAFVCPLPEVSRLNSIETYALSVEGPQVELGGPIYLRVFPTIPLPQTISLDLSDDVFARNFVTSREYWKKWTGYIALRPPTDVTSTLRRYLIARAYYHHVASFQDSQTAFVLRVWMEAAALLSQRGSPPIFAVDGAVVEAAENLRQAMYKLERSEVFDKYGPKQEHSEQLEVADWVVYGQIRGTARAPAERFIEYCRLFAALRERWPSGNDENAKRKQALIQRLHRVTEERLITDRTQLPLSSCPTDNVASALTGGPSSTNPHP